MPPASAPGATASDKHTDAVVVDVLGDGHHHGFSFKRLLQFMGPGILMSIAYVGLVVQMQAAKLGVVTGRHLAQHCRQQYPTVPRIALWLMAEVAIIGSDVQEVIGSAIALALLSGGRLPLWAGVLLTAVDSFALLFIERLGVRVLEGFFAGMVGVMVAAFGIMYGRADVPSGEVLRGFTLPSLPRKDVPVAVALMGSLIMPHNIYLHSALVQSRRLASDRPAAKREALTYFGIESALSLVVAVVINLFITAVFAAGFYGRDLPDIGLQNAGRYLGQTYGPVVVYIWALGLLAAGQSSTMTGTYTGQFVMGGYLDLKVSPWARVTITRAVAILPTLAVALLCGRGDGTQLDTLNQGLNLLQSVQLPFALVPVLTFTSSRAIMGEFANTLPLALLCWSIAGLVVGINGLALYEVAFDWVVGDPWVSGAALGVTVLAYFALLGYLVFGPQSAFGARMGWGSGPKSADQVEREVAAKAAAKAAAAAGASNELEAALEGLADGDPAPPCGCCPACRCWEVAVEAAEADEKEEAHAGAALRDGCGGGCGGSCSCCGAGRRKAASGKGVAAWIRAAALCACGREEKVGKERQQPAIIRAAGSCCGLCGGALVPEPGSGMRKVISACTVDGGAAAPAEAPDAKCPACCGGNGGGGADGGREQRDQRRRRRPRRMGAVRAGGSEDDELERPLLLSESDGEVMEDEEEVEGVEIVVEEAKGKLGENANGGERSGGA
ncbi:hypothetical protein GPECTOR_12g388 [Gonium pectorale]|uniref:Uncharacterized protein n=1 Tax=Gonium pectorale TaxID=33097 RepID=A0A150GNJ0_GONPE|nr:hypothetical protein GPECTOR_12g388 [Gonium pectorale]|eukprot:KXZ51426.1 hypothetical protein GPECTOR_12g388 [Gonium pectorale]